MYIDLQETMLQIQALAKICYWKPNGWREVAIGLIAISFLPFILLICLLSNSHPIVTNRKKGKPQ